MTGGDVQIFYKNCPTYYIFLSYELCTNFYQNCVPSKYNLSYDSRQVMCKFLLELCTFLLILSHNGRRLCAKFCQNCSSVLYFHYYDRKLCANSHRNHKLWFFNFGKLYRRKTQTTGGECRRNILISSRGFVLLPIVQKYIQLSQMLKITC